LSNSDVITSCIRQGDTPSSTLDGRDVGLPASAIAVDPPSRCSIDGRIGYAALKPPTDHVSLPQDAKSIRSRCLPEVPERSFRRILSRFNPWSEIRKKEKVREGSMHYEMDEHGEYRYYDSSLVIALLQTTWRPMSLAICYKAARVVLDTTSSLVTKQLIAFITTSHAWSKATEEERASGGLKPPKGISHGIGLAIGLAVMQEVALLCGNHFHLKSYGCGRSGEGNSMRSC
jgi:hypothetical protein